MVLNIFNFKKYNGWFNLKDDYNSPKKLRFYKNNLKNNKIKKYNDDIYPLF